MHSFCTEENGLIQISLICMKCWEICFHVSISRKLSNRQEILAVIPLTTPRLSNLSGTLKDQEVWLYRFFWVLYNIPLTIESATISISRNYFQKLYALCWSWSISFSLSELERGEQQHPPRGAEASPWLLSHAFAHSINTILCSLVRSTISDLHFVIFLIILWGEGTSLGGVASRQSSQSKH